MMALLTVDKLSKTYQATSKKAVKDISFAVDHGDIVAFLGLNGAGKTTTLKMILNLVSPDHGKVYFEGKEMTNSNLLLLKKIREFFWKARGICFGPCHRLRILFIGVANEVYLEKKRSIMAFNC